MIHYNTHHDYDCLLKESLGRKGIAASKKDCQGFPHLYLCDLQHCTPCKGNDVLHNYAIQSNLHKV